MVSKSDLPAADLQTDDKATKSEAVEGNVRLRDVTVSLKSDVGQAFVADFARHFEGIRSSAELKAKWELDEKAFEAFASNSPLLAAVRAEHERRIFRGECAREAAQRHFSKAPDILNHILTNEEVAPRHRIEAARELRQTASSGPEIAPGPQEKFKIIINLGDETFVKEVHDRPLLLKNNNDGQPS